MKLAASLALGILAGSGLASANGKNYNLETTPKFATAKLAYYVDLWLARTKPNQNSVYSPVSLYNVLASVYFGTGKDSETRKELQEHFNFKPEFSPQKYAGRLGDMTKSKALETFNSYVFHKGNMQEEYAQDLSLLNFKDEKLESFVDQEQRLNGIVEKDTNGMIKEMFQEGSFDDMTSLVLLNTILFMGKWDEQYGEFKESATILEKNWVMGTAEDSPGPFEAEFMRSKKRKLRVYETNRMNHISIRFEENSPEEQVWMTIVMPKVGSAIQAHEVNFNNITWDSFKKNEATLILPKFEIESELDLKAFMQDKGASRLFSSSTAELSRMFGEDSQEYVGKFKQKASIKVHEKGAEAAAATAVEMVMKSMPKKQRVYNIRRPFKFFIHSLKSDTVIAQAKANNNEKLAKQSGSLFFSGVVNCPMNNCN